MFIRTAVNKAVADTGGLYWFSLKPPFIICMHEFSSGQVGDTLLLVDAGKELRELIS